MTQREYLTNLCAQHKDAVIIGSIGSVSYDLSEIEHPNKILLRGAMGAAVACGLGFALASGNEVIVVIGEGSLLMKLGSLSTVLAHKPHNLKIKVINNGCYKSCGGQSNNFKALNDSVVLNYPNLEVIHVEI